MKKQYIILFVGLLVASSAFTVTPTSFCVGVDYYSAQRDVLQPIQRPVAVVFVIPAIIGGLTALEAAGLITLTGATGYCLFKVGEELTPAVESLILGEYLWTEAPPDGFEPDPSKIPGGGQPEWLKGMARLLAGSLVLGEAGKGLYMAGRSDGYNLQSAQLAFQDELVAKGFVPYGYNDATGAPVASGFVFRVTTWEYVVRNAGGWFKFQVMDDGNGKMIANTPIRILARDGRAVAHKAMINSPSWQEGIATISNKLKDFQRRVTALPDPSKVRHLLAFADGQCFAGPACVGLQAETRNAIQTIISAPAQARTEYEWEVLRHLTVFEFETSLMQDMQSQARVQMTCIPRHAMPYTVTPDGVYQVGQLGISQTELVGFARHISDSLGCSPLGGPDPARMVWGRNPEQLFAYGWIPILVPGDNFYLVHCSGADPQGREYVMRIDLPHKFGQRTHYHWVVGQIGYRGVNPASHTFGSFFPKSYCGLQLDVTSDFYPIFYDTHAPMADAVPASVRTMYSLLEQAGLRIKSRPPVGY